MKKTNKIISILLVIAMMLTMAPLSFTASAASGTCGPNATWDLTNDTLTISGSGAIPDYDSNYSVPWANQRSSVNKLVIESGITSIGKYAFIYCSNLTSVVYGGTVNNIRGYESFSSCKRLTSFTLLEGIGQSGNAFFACKKLNANGIKLVDSNGNDKTEYYTVSVVGNDVTSSNHAITVKGNLEKGSITAIPDQIYTGSEVKPAVAVNWNGQTVSSNNYDLAYSNNIEEGTATVTVTGKGDYTGTLTQTFKIFECKHEGQAGICGVCGKNLHIHAYNYTANGNVITATCSNSDGYCTDTNGGTLTISAPADLYADGITAKEATVENNLVDTSVAVGDITYSSGSAPKTAGTYTASVTVGGATANVEYTLVKKNAAADMFVFSAPANLVYDGTLKYATVEVSPEITGMGAVTVAYYKDGVAVDPINAGTYTVKVSTAESDKYYALTDVELGSFTIEKKEITAFATVADKVYDGTTDIDASAIEITFDGIVDGDDFEVSKCIGIFLSSNAGNNKTIYVTYDVSGKDVNNYDICEDGVFIPEKEYYYIETKANILPRDIADAEIVLGDALTYNGAEQTQSIASVTVGGLDVTYTVSGNTEKNVGVYQLKITGTGNFTGEATALYEIAVDVSGLDYSEIDGYYWSDVKSTDKDRIEYVYNQINNAEWNEYADAEKKAEWNTLRSNCYEMLLMINSVTSHLANLKEEVAGYDVDTVTSDDYDYLEGLYESEAQWLYDFTENYTDEEIKEFSDTLDTISTLLDRIAETKSEYERLIAAANGYDEATVTSADKDALVQLNEDIYALALTENVTAEEKENLQAAHDKVFALIDKLVGISDEIKRITEKVDAYVFESVKSTDKADIQQLIADIKALLDTQNLTADERALLETEDETCDKLVEKIDETVAEINRIDEATNAYDEATVTSADKEAIEQLIADIKALTDGDNITDAEREQLKDNKATLDALLAKIKATAEEIARIEETVNGYDEATVKSTDKADLEQLKADIKALTDATNITEDERAKLGNLDATLDSLIKKIDDTVAEIARIDEAVNSYDMETVTSADIPALGKLIDDIKALTDGQNITDDEKAALEANDEAIDELVEKLTEVAEEIKRVDEAVKSYDEETVKSTDKADLEQLKEDIQALIDSTNTTENEKTALGGMLEKDNALIDVIDEIEQQIEDIGAFENNFNPEKVTSDDKAAIEEKIAEIENVNPDNLTEEQKAEYAEIKADLEALLEEIEKAGSEVDAVGAEREMFDEERVTIFWEDEIEALKAKIDELLADENMGKTEKAKLEEYKAQCEKLIEIINNPSDYFSMRLFHFVWDALHWLSSHVVFIFNWIVSMF